MRFRVIRRRDSLSVCLERIQRFGVPPPLVQRGGRGDRTKVGDSWRQRLILRGNGPESLAESNKGQDWHDEAGAQARITARDGVLLESSGSFGYECGVKSDNWEIL